MSTNLLLVGASAKPFAWSQRAHLPALTALGTEQYTIQTISSSSDETAAKAKEVFAPAKAAYGTTATACANSKADGVDIAVISVNVAIHTKPCLAAADANTTILCEWPLGKSMEDTQRIADYAKAKNVKGFVMAQSVMQPALRHIKTALLPSMGAVHSVNVTAHTPVWAHTVYLPYLCDRTSGGSMISIPMGHTIAGLRSVFGEIAKISAYAAVSRPSKPITAAPAAGAPNMMDCTTYDNVSVSGRFASGALLSYNFRGDAVKTDGMIIEIQCESGHIKIVADTAFAEMTKMKVFKAAVGSEYELVEVPALLEETGGVDLDANAECVARFYYHLRRHLAGEADAITVTFEDAVKNYRVVDAIIRSADADGEAITL